MSTPNKYFDSPTQRPEHPRVRAWRSYRKDPSVHYVEVEVRRKREGLFVLPARLFVFFCSEDGEVVRTDETAWESELESWLIDKEKARAATIDNEKLRFSLLLKPALRPIPVRYGDDYFNSVLVTGLKEGPFGTHTEIVDVLRDIHEYPPAGGSLLDCQELIDFEFATMAKRLLELYDDDRATAEDILGGAIARYLDDRFSVSDRRQLGWASH